MSREPELVGRREVKLKDWQKPENMGPQRPGKGYGLDPKTKDLCVLERSHWMN